MKFKVQAGAELEIPSQREIQDAVSTVMTSWISENMRGGRYRRLTAMGTITGGSLSIGGPDETHQLGPASGYVWDVRRLFINGYQLTAPIDVVWVYVNDASSGSVIASTTQSESGLFRFDRQVVLYSGDNLMLAGLSLAAAGPVYVTGTVLEYPASQAWRL